MRYNQAKGVTGLSKSGLLVAIEGVTIMITVLIKMKNINKE